MRLANKEISSVNRERIRVERQRWVLPELHGAPPTSHLSSTLIIIHYSIFISHPEAAESRVCNVQLTQEGSYLGGEVTDVATESVDEHSGDAS